LLIADCRLKSGAANCSAVNRQSAIENQQFQTCPEQNSATEERLTMLSKGRLELSVLGTALVMGILADALLRAVPWGLNLLIWSAGLSAAIAFHARCREETLAGGGQWWLVAVVLFALGVAWHDSPALKILSLLGILTVLSLVILRAQGGRVRFAGLAKYALGAVVAGFNAAFGLLPVLFGEAEWKKLLGGRWSQRAMAVVRGVLLALPFLLIFGGLFMAADAVFDNIVRKTFHVNFQRVFTHFFVAAFFAWCVGGYLRGMLWGKEISVIEEKRRPSFSLGIIEGAVTLGALDLLFLAFVLVQVRYFFGGSVLVQATTGLTYAEYARGGFFELVAVAALLLPLLLLMHWLIARSSPTGERVFRVLAGVQILLLFVIMASAFQRMRLYQAEYGLTEPRLYPTAFMGWLVVVFLWFAVTVLSGRRERFAFGAMVAGFLLIIVLQALNPDAFIARTNLARAKAGRSFDALYATRLGADAVPELVEGLPNLNPQDRCTVAAGVLKRWAVPRASDWRAWSWSRARAAQVVRESQIRLKAVQCPSQN
jgi:hypothetical protein